MNQKILNVFNGLAFTDLAFLVVFSVLFLIRLLYLFLFTGRILFRQKLKISDSAKKPLSLILAVRDQEENLKNNLPKILSTESVDFEMVIVDDYSQDNSYLVLGLLKKRYKRLKISMLNQETRYSMKLAQNIALKAAGNDWVLTIPVSVSEFSPEWLAAVSKVADNNKNVIIGYSNIRWAKGFFNQLFRIESYFQYLKSVGFIQNGIPFVYSEENIAFQKSKYFEIGGFGQKITEPYANLELLINSFIRKNSTVILLGKETKILKSESINGTDYYELLKKSFRIEKHLSYFKRSVLVFEEITRLVILPYAFVVIVLFTGLWPVVAVLFFLKFLLHLVIIKITQNRLNERKIFISSLLYDLAIPYLKLFYRWHFNRRNKKKGWRSKV